MSCGEGIGVDMPTHFAAVDCESFSNWFCVCVYDGATLRAIDSRSPTWRGEVREVFLDKDLVAVSHNGFHYDNLLIKTILANAHVPVFTPAQVNEVSKRIINSEGRMPDDLFKLQYANEPWAYTVDMYQLLNKKGGLKAWECHEHYPTVVEAPVDFDAPLPPDRMDEVAAYCGNDVQATWMLFQKYKHLCTLREGVMQHFDVGERVFALGDAGVAKAVAMADYKDRTGGWGATAREAAANSPDNTARAWPTTLIAARRTTYTTAPFQAFYREFLAQTLIGNGGGTTWDYKGGRYDEPVTLGGKSYQIGVGGLHSIDAPGVFRSTADVAIYDLDVASYYPSLILTLGLYPKHLGAGFLDTYRRIRDERIEAKHKGDKLKADTYKLVLNSTFGLLNEAHSPIRSIPSALRVTINGQLQLLMLIEALETMGARVLSCNTDGVTIMWHRSRQADLDAVKTAWQTATGHELEQAEYAVYARRDVNSYVALYADGEKVKTKGAFEQAPLGGKRDERIVKHAAQEWLLKRTPIRQTITASNDIRDFIYYQQIKNGGTIYHGTAKVGKVARWYASTSGAVVHALDPNGKWRTLPDGHRATLALTLPTAIPADLDREHYVAAAVALCESVVKAPKARKAKE